MLVVDGRSGLVGCVRGSGRKQARSSSEYSFVEVSTGSEGTETALGETEVRWGGWIDRQLVS